MFYVAGISDKHRRIINGKLWLAYFFFKFTVDYTKSKQVAVFQGKFFQKSLLWLQKIFILEVNQPNSLPSIKIFKSSNNKVFNEFFLEELFFFLHIARLLMLLLLEISVASSEKLFEVEVMTPKTLVELTLLLFLLISIIYSLFTPLIVSSSCFRVH